MKSTFLSFVLLLSLFSCKDKNESLKDNVKQKDGVEKKYEDKVRTISTLTTNYDTLVNQVKNKGNLEAYEELFYSFKDSRFEERTDSVMVYSKIMAEKYNIERAYFDYFQAVCEKNNIDYSNFPEIDLTKIDKLSKQKIVDWLSFMVAKGVITQDEFSIIKK